MKVLIVNSLDIQGGAARAAYRLQEALAKDSIDVYMLVQSKTSSNFRVLSPKTRLGRLLGKIRPSLDSIPNRFYRDRTQTLFSSNYLPSNSIIKRINQIKPDVVHLHWVAGGLLRIEDIAKIQAPIVWSLHDMWAFTGGCHYDEECGLYVTSCNKCKVLKSFSYNDLSSINFKRKSKTYQKIKKLHINGSSKWITNSAKSSSLLKERTFSTLPNPIDSKLFKPITKAIARDMFKIPLDKKVVLFPALNPLGDPRKGYEQLKEALSILEIDNLELVIAGSSRPETPELFNFPAHYVPMLSDDYSLALLYNAADVVVVPSIQENLANSVVESLMCGVPVVAFDIGGNPDMIQHKLNGFLAEPFGGEGLAQGIEWVLSHANYKELSIAARTYAVDSFSYEALTVKYIQLYKKLISMTTDS